mmetsp:Transcript_3887/g.5205  ORF Transcript_3887/g.5205 Transcript_3887/m.5205 type:complete len:101 (+) Transcript_3887:419-721(+)
MHWAAMFGSLESARRLAEGGANLDVQSKAGDTPLHLAAEKNRPDFIAWALEEGADPTIENEASQSPFSVAKKHKNKECTKLLALPGSCGCSCGFNVFSKS